MRWKVAKEPKTGDTRIKICFAWVPLRIKDQYIWLEKYKCKQEYGWRHVIIPGGTPFYDWITIERDVI